MKHEPFYVSGTMSEDSLRVDLGWACFEGALADSLPIWNEQRDVCMVFVGEAYADQAALQDSTPGPKTEGGMTVAAILKGYEEKGVDYLRQLNGWFSGVILDLREKKAFLFNDRFGLGRIYYVERGGTFYFSSEAKSLLKVFSELRRLNSKGLAEFLTCNCVLEDRTLFEGISLLPAGSLWTFQRERPVRREFYFRPSEWESGDTFSAAQFHEELRTVWSRLLPHYFAGPELPALSLTGGIDSRMILAWAPTPRGTLPCYTFGGHLRDCMDVKVARKAADICQQSHQVISIGQKFLDEFSALAEKAVYISDGCMDVTGAVDLYGQRLARQVAPARITGTNGGEILRRLVAFKPVRPDELLFQSELRKDFQESLETYAESRRCHPLTFTAFKQTPWFMHAKFAVERSQLSLRMPYLDNNLVSLAYRTPTELAESCEPALRVIKSGNPRLLDLRTDRGLALKLSERGANFGHKFQQFLFRAEYAFDYGMPQWLARVNHALSPLNLEKLFLGRHKIHHFRVHYRDGLGAYVKEVLLDPSALNRGYVQRKRLEAIVKEHTDGRRNHTLSLHKVLTLELIHRGFLGHSVN